MAHPNFILQTAKDGQFYFVLTAKNGQTIAQSEMYTTRAAAENGIESVRENAPVAELDDQTAQAA